jgi:subtilisin-like proprotein convertase family protein
LQYVPSSPPPPNPNPNPQPNPTPEVKAVRYAAIVDAAIPDNNMKGLESRVTATEAPNGRKVRVEVDITHPWRGDLIVTLIAPDGQTFVLANRTGRSEDDIIGTYGETLTADQSLNVLSALQKAGEWKLQVTDRAARDTGRLNKWALRFD